MFAAYLKKNHLDINRTPTEVVQINIGRLCNQACLHCHVEAGPKRTENMNKKTVDRLIELLEKSKTVHTIDLTGGAPELNENFKYLVKAARSLGKNVIDRCNLTVLFEPNQQDTAQFLKENSVHVIASLPCYSKDNVEKQRGHGVFNKSIQALKNLNELGYGKPNTDLKLDLVYNPVGPSLPPHQKTLETKYKSELKELFNIEFNSLFTITNMPIKRFLYDLEKSKKYDEYMTLLSNSFNPHTAQTVMCRNLVSISWDGQIFDCDFNQMLELPLGSGKKNIWDIDNFNLLAGNKITFADHCFACTAGAGSSCGGALI